MNEGIKYAAQLIPQEDHDAISQRMQSFGDTYVTVDTVIEMVIYSYWLGYQRSMADAEEVKKDNEDS